MHRSLIIFFAAIFLLGVIRVADAQLFNFNISLKIRPEIPGPRTTVSAKLEGYGTDINNSYITWTLNDEIIQKGIGSKQISFVTGEIGSSYDLRVTITQQNNAKITTSAFFRVGDIDLIWHTNGYTPPFYPGKALVAKRATATVTAIPYLYKDGQKISADNLIYTWRIDDRNAVASSGFNKQSFTFDVDGVIKHSHLVEVTISDLQKTTRATKSIKLVPDRQEILIYENRPLSGPAYQRAVTNFHAASESEYQFIAAPFYFTISTGVEQLNYEWIINGVKETDKNSKNFLFDFRSLSNVTGELVIDSGITNKKSPFQTSSANFQIKVE